MGNEKIPFHIRVIGTLVGLVNESGNKATGEIIQGYNNRPYLNPYRFRDKVLYTRYIDNIPHDTLWVHLGNNYFKMVGAWPQEPGGL